MCRNQCRCHYDYQLNYNAYNCSATNITGLLDPSDLTRVTDVLNLSKNGITEFCGKQPYLRTVAELDLSQDVICKICEETVDYMKTGSIIELKIANNTITWIPSKISNISSLRSVMLSRNKYICNCKMTWMIKWLSKRSSNGERIVKDYKDVICHSGMLIGKQIYKLTSDEMGCYPHKLSTGEKVTIGIFGALIVGIVVAIIVISRRWNEVKCFFYLHFNILDKRDDNEDLTGKKYDAFVSYRY